METAEMQQVPFTRFQQAQLDLAGRVHLESVREQARIRAGVHFIAWVAGIWMALTLIGGIYVAVVFANAANTFNNVGDITTCQSLGGTDTSC